MLGDGEAADDADDGDGEAADDADDSVLADADGLAAVDAVPLVPPDDGVPHAASTNTSSANKVDMRSANDDRMNEPPCSKPSAICVGYFTSIACIVWCHDASFTGAEREIHCPAQASIRDRVLA